MNFNIYLDDKTATELGEAAKKSGKTRNAVIREAINGWLNQQKTNWPQTILDFQGITDAPAFEQYRDELQSPDVDPLA